MKNGAAIILLMLAVCITSLNSCDTPKSIAWSYYYCAEDTLNTGNPYAAKRFLDACKTNMDKALSHKVDSLKIVIDKAIEEDKVQQR